MARLLRIEFEGALYHVMAHRNARADIFLCDARLHAISDSTSPRPAGLHGERGMHETRPDPSFVQRIRAVVANGRFLDRQALDGLLQEAERAAKESKSNED